MNKLRHDSMPGRTLSFEVWCYTRKLKRGRYIEKSWKVKGFNDELTADGFCNRLQKKDGWGFLPGTNPTGRRYFVKTITKDKGEKH
jgi:hypothetical protein